MGRRGARPEGGDMDSDDPMLTAVVMAARLIQFSGATVLFGAPFFFLYGLPATGGTEAARLAWPRPLLASTCVMVLAGAVLYLCAQTAIMAGDRAEAFNPDTLVMVVQATGFGLAVAIRMALVILALVLCVALRPSRTLWVIVTALGLAILASFAWTGHAAAGKGAPGLLHLVSDVVHLVAAGVWLGALAALAFLVAGARNPKDKPTLATLHAALHGFSGIGSLVVAALLASGIVNSWFLVGPDHVLTLLTSPYGVLLAVKVAAFAGMLAFAAMNRFRLTPALKAARGTRPTIASVRALRRSIGLESALGLAVVLLVAILGMLPPPSMGMM